MKRWKSLEVRESDVLSTVIRFMRIHPAIDWAQRMNVGAFKVGATAGQQRYIRFGFPGCSDIIGQLQDGRMIAVECKAPKGRLTPEQTAFLRRVGCKGVAIVARELQDVRRVLDALLTSGR